MVKFIFLVLLLNFPTLTNALPTFIEGKVIQGNGMVIRISAYSDYLTLNEKLLGTYEIDTEDNFKLGFEIADIQELIIKIGNQSFSFFAEEGKCYKLQIDNLEIPPKSALSEQKPLHLVWGEKNALNEAIENFNYTISDFLDKNFIDIYKYRDAKLLQSFENEIIEKLANTSNLSPKEKIFFENLIAYQLAELKTASRTVSDSKLGETYLKNKNVLDNHPDYMLFLSHYFDHYFLSGKRGTKYNDFVEIIHSGAKINKLMDYLAKDPILENERLRELVLLNALKEVYYNKDFDETQIIKLISEIAKISKFSEHKIIGNNILNLLTSMQIGASAPEFKLMSTEGVFKRLEDYKGRYVYLVFLSDNCQACEADLPLIENLFKKYKSDIAVLGIMVNYTKDGLTKFTQESKPSLELLLFENNFELLNTYRLRNYPFYILIDRQGKILLNPAKKPNEGIDSYFDFLLKRDKDKNRRPDILFH